MAMPVQMTMADDTSTSGQTAPAGGSTTAGGSGAATGSQGQKLERLKEAMAALDLTEAQKEQIKQIRSSTTPGQDRGQQILAVLTPEQKAKLREMIMAHRDAGQGGAASTANAEDN